MISTRLIFIGLLSMWLSLAYLILSQPQPQKRTLDCSMESFHPDFTPEMRKACREHRRKL
jgi:hypothetical protein